MVMVHSAVGSSQAWNDMVSYDSPVRAVVLRALFSAAFFLVFFGELADLSDA